MKISKLKLVTKYLTGGVANVVEYLLDQFNEMIQRLPVDKVVKYAQLAKDVANFIQNLANALVTNEAKKRAALATAQCFAELATALLDATLAREELELVVDAAKEAVEAWKEAK